MEKSIVLTNKRKIYIDVLKILCCFLVIVNHTNSRIFLSTVSLEDGVSITYILSMAYFYLSRLAVPIFFMISGALLLNKEIHIKELMKNRILRFTLVVFLFSIIYYIYYNAIQKNIDIWHIKNIVEFVKSIYSNHITNAYWFLYSYIGILIMLPILKKMVSNFSKNDYYYLFIIYIVFQSVLPILEKVFGIEGMSQFIKKMFFNEIIIYFIMGHFIVNVNKMEKYSKYKLFIAVFNIVLYIVLASGYTVFNLKKSGQYDLFFADTESIIRLIPCISLFYIVKHIFDKINLNKKIESILIWISKCTLGVYLISDLIISLTEKEYQNISLYMHPMISMIIWQMVIFILGVIITSIMKNISGIKKLV